MDTYRCDDCGWIIDGSELDHFYEDGIKYTCCPHCQSTELTYLEYNCKCCGEPCESDYCEECKEDIKTIWNEFIEKMKTELSEEEYDLFREMYNNEDLIVGEYKEC